MLASLRRSMIALGLMALALGTAAGAEPEPQQVCTLSLPEIEARLIGELGEKLYASALAGRQSLIWRLYGNPGTGTWTWLHVNSEGQVCGLVSGERFLPVEAF